MLNDPIIACSTCDLADAAIAVVRISGINDFSILDTYFEKAISPLPSQKAARRKLLYNGKSIDDVIVTLFRAPNSYTGENVLELSVHGNRKNISRIISNFVKDGVCRLASAGEFTHRAYKNKKLTLGQVEGLGLFLSANSPLALDQGLELLNGELFETYQSLYQQFLALKASLELGIDFVEDVGEATFLKNVEEKLDSLTNLLTPLAKRSHISPKLILAPLIVMSGLPNAGKSSFFNTFLGEERSIVTHIPGTTRDYVSETITIAGVDYRFTDTAGLRESTDPVEMVGVERSLRLKADAFFKILVLNCQNEISSKEEALLKEEFDLIVVTHIDLGLSSVFFEDLVKTAHFKTLILGNFSELKMNKNYIQYSLADGRELYLEKEQSGPIGPLLKKYSKMCTGPIGPQKNGGETGPIGPVLSKNASGPIGPLERELDVFLPEIVSNKYNSLTADRPILVERHGQLIRSIYLKLKEFRESQVYENDVVLAAFQCDQIYKDIADLIGFFSPDDVLSSIFQNFCIGK